MSKQELENTSIESQCPKGIVPICWQPDEAAPTKMTDAVHQYFADKAGYVQNARPVLVHGSGVDPHYDACYLVASVYLWLHHPRLEHPFYLEVLFKQGAGNANSRLELRILSHDEPLGKHHRLIADQSRSCESWQLSGVLSRLREQLAQLVRELAPVGAGN
jgi:hypothetical protein